MLTHDTCGCISDFDNSLNIEPQYDGVIMLSADDILFSDAKARPDGKKVYHIFEKDSEAESEMYYCEEFCVRRDQLLSLAHKKDADDIQMVLADNGDQEWCAIIPGIYSSLPFVVREIRILQDILVLEPVPLCNYQLHQRRLSKIKIHYFEMSFPSGPDGLHIQNRFLKKMKRRGYSVEFQPENRRIEIKTKKSALTVLALLHSIDPNARHVYTAQEVILESVGDCSI